MIKYHDFEQYYYILVLDLAGDMNLILQHSKTFKIFLDMRYFELCRRAWHYSRL